MAISNASATTINKMNVASQRVLLGTIVQGLQTSVATLQIMKSGSMGVYALHTNASAVALTIGVASSKGYIVDIYRSGSKLSHTAYVTTPSGSLILTDNAGYTTTVGDKIYWIQY